MSAGPQAAGNFVTLFGQQIALPFSLPAFARQVRFQQRLILGGAAVIVLLILFALFPLIAAVQLGKADQALATAYGHQSKVDAAMTDFLKVQTSAATPDAERALINKELQADQAALDLVQKDEASIQSMDPLLAIFQWVAFPKRQAITAERNRLATALKGLKAADQALTAFTNQDKLALPLVDVGQDYIKIATALGKRDLAAAGAPYPDAHQKMQDVLQLVGAPGVPNEYVKFVNDFNTLLDNTESLVQAIQAKDNAGIQKYGTLVQTNAKAVSAFDASATEASNRKTYQPMIDAYDANLKSAKNS